MAPLIWLAKTIGIYGLVAAAAFGWHLYERGRAYDAGQRDERLVWQEKARRWQIATQAKVDAIEDGWNEERRRQAAGHMEAIAELERAIADEKSNRSGRGPVCPPAISRGVSRALDKVGR